MHLFEQAELKDPNWEKMKQHSICFTCHVWAVKHCSTALRYLENDEQLVFILKGQAVSTQ